MERYVFAGYTIIQMTLLEEAVDDKAGRIEVRQFFEFEDFGPSEAVERFREMGVIAKK